MRILIITQLFDPEPNHTRGVDFARALMASGHEVEVLTGFPNYPSGRLAEGYRLRWWKREQIEGVSIIRVAMLPTGSGGALRRVLNYLTLALSVCVPGLFLVRRPDLVHVYQGPATLFLPALLGRMMGRPYLIDLQDLWPESVICSVKRGTRLLSVALGLWCRLGYRFASRIVLLSEGYRGRLFECGVEAEKMEVIHNWANERTAASQDGVDRRIDQSHSPVELVYAGNMGPFQELEIVLHAAERLQEQEVPVRFTMIGEGSERAQLMALAKERMLENVTFCDWLSWTELQVRLRQADGLLMHLCENELTRIAIPSKTQAYLSLGIPIIAAVPGETGALFRNAGVDWVCEPGRPDVLASAISDFVERSPSQRLVSAERGRLFYQTNLCSRLGVMRFAASYYRALEAA